MALDRYSIEKKDFPVGQRGYDPGAVDAHLRWLAGEVEELKQESRRRSESLANAASEQLRAIVAAAETSAAEIQRHAEEEVRAVRHEAGGEAEAVRRHAMAEAREYVAKVSDAATAMLERIDSIESELRGLLDSLRAASSRVGDDLQRLESELGAVSDRTGSGARFEAETGSGTRVDAEPEPVAREPEPVAERPEPVAAPDAEPVPAPHSNGADDEGARLIVLNMALNGTPREETERYLAENFATLSDRRGLLDEVYASVEE